MGTGGDVAGGVVADELLNALPDATAILDDSGTITAVNRAWCVFGQDNRGQPEKTGVGVNYLEVCARSAAIGCSDAVTAAAGLKAVLNGDTAHSELEYPCPTPTAELWFLLRITPLARRRGGAVVSHTNITRRRAAEQELAHQAAHDPLTALANRTLFRDRLAAALRPPAEHRSNPGHVGVLYVDLDGLKQVNDTYGHDAGDLLIQAAARRLRSQVRAVDTVARLGGDEFAVIAPRITATGLNQLATRADTALAQSHHIHGHDLHAPASIGSHLAAPGDDLDEVIRRADRAMYAVKLARSSRRDEPPPPQR
jgi:diguanylate cyclase (GGDEF)-like protein